MGKCKHVVAVWTGWEASGGNFTEQLEKDFGGHQEYCPHVSTHPGGKLRAPVGGLQGLGCFPLVSKNVLITP